MKPYGIHHSIVASGWDDCPCCRGREVIKGRPQSADRRRVKMGGRGRARMQERRLLKRELEELD